MGRERLLKIGGVNIRVHTKHAPTEYVELWKAFHRLRKPKTRGSTATMIGDVRRLNDSTDSPFYGYIYRFVDIDPDDPWFDIEEHKKADDVDVAQVKIPKKLKPNLQEFPYVFDVTKHRLFFKSGGHDGGLSPGIVTAMMQNLAASERIVQRFGEVDITTLTRKGTIERLLAWPQIRRINVVLERPNPSDFDDEKSYYDRLKRRSLKREEHTYVKEKGAASITPDAEMKRIFNIAADNGVYTQTGVDAAGDVKTASSKNYPMQEITSYDPDFSTETDAFTAFVTQQMTS